VVRAVGVLTLGSAPMLRTAVRKCLAALAVAVVVDLSTITVDEDTAARVFPSLARGAFAFAGANLVLCTGSPALRKALIGPAATGCLPVYGTLDEAVVAALGIPPPQRVRRWLPGTPSAAAAARQVIRDACRRWAVEHLADRAATIGTELVSNVVLHAGTDFVLSVAMDRCLHIAVRDGSTRRARLGGAAGPEDFGGRGLMVVEALAAAWGSTPDSTGKVVWAALSTRPLTAW